MMEFVLLALADIFTLDHLLLLFAGVGVGMILGAIPGLSATMGIALIIPFTLSMGPVPALLMMMGAYKGGIYGGSVAAILLKAPGTSAASATVADGYALAKQGKGLKALKVSLVASVIGDTFSDIVLILVAAQLAKVALQFGAVEYTIIAILALTIIGSASGKSLMKGIFAASAGLAVSLVGLDPTSGLPRLTFGVIEFYGGIHLLPMLIGLLIISELVVQIEQSKNLSAPHLPNASTSDDSRITKADAKLMVRPVVGGSIIGTVIGIIPGLGPTLGAFLGYDNAWRFAKKPKLFGKGSVEGIAGAESGNNAVSGANLIPLLGLGIPGDTEAAILVGAFLIHGLTPGPLIFQEAPDVVYGIYVGLLLANVALLVIGWSLIPVFVRAAKIRVGLLFPVVLLMSLVGAYSFQQSVFDVGLALVFAVIGYLMAKLEIPKTSFLIGFILAALLEDNFRRSLQLSDGAYSTFLSSNLGNVLWLISIASVATVFIKLRNSKKVTRREVHGEKNA
jgi:putative tricarboxylic transport membrane protein